MSKKDTTRKLFAAVKDGVEVYTGSMQEIADAIGRSRGYTYTAYKNGWKSNGYEIKLLPYTVCVDCGMRITEFNKYKAKKKVRRCQYCQRRYNRQFYYECKDFSNEKRNAKRRKVKETKTCIICSSEFETAKADRQKTCASKECQKEYKRIRDKLYRGKIKKEKENGSI